MRRRGSSAVADRADRVGHCGERDRDALERVAVGLPVQRLVLAELLEHDHRQKARARPGPRDGVERRRRLADLLAVPAGELLPHRLDHLPPPRRRLQRPRHVLAELAQAVAAAARAGRRRIDHHPLARQMVGERVALGAPAVKARTVVVFAAACSAASSSSVALAASSSNASASCSISRVDRSDRCP